MTRLILPAEFNFFFFAGQIGEGPGRRAHYVSDMHKDAAVAAMKSFIVDSEKNPDSFGKHTL